MDKIREIAPAKDIIATLECSICSSVPIPPVRVFECREGKHIICGDCKRGMPSSDMCQCPSLWSDKRCFFAEKILETTLFNCKYDDQGCPEILTGRLHEHHLKICKYRPMICNIKTHEPCTNFSVHTRWYLEHLKHNHHVEGTILETEDGNSLRAVTNPQCKDAQICYVVYDEKQFLVHSVFLNDHLFVWVTLLDNKDLHQQYNAKIVFTRRNCIIKNTWFLPVHPPQTELVYVVRSLRCAGFPTILMPPYLEPHSNMMPFVCTIEKINAPENADN